MNRRATILIVDDETVLRRNIVRVVERLLKKESCDDKIEVVEAESGEHALVNVGRIDEDQKYCLVSDIEMPGMSGFELVESLRDRFNGRLLVKMLQSGHHFFREEAEELGCIFAPKGLPAHRTQLEAAVRRFIDLVE